MPKSRTLFRTILTAVPLLAGAWTNLQAQDTTRTATARLPVSVSRVATGLKAWQAFKPNVEPQLEGGECRRFDAPDDVVHLSMSFPDWANRHTSISVQIARNGDLVRYVENRNVLRNIAQNIAAEPRTTFQVDFRSKSALAMNTGGAEPNHGARITLEQLRSLEDYKILDERMKLVLQRCSGATP